jgi:tetratricopeptide (TPR) repeat protein
VSHAAFSPDGRRVVTASLDQTARVWDAATGQPVTPPLKHNGSVFHAAFSPDGRCVVTASLDRTARVWDAATGQPITPPLKHGGPVQYAALSPNGRCVVTASGDQSARVWDAATGQPVTPPLKHNGWVSHAAFSPDGRCVVTASADQTARVWDVGTGQPLTPRLKHNGVVSHAAFSPEGRRVVTASYDQTARVWDAATGLPIPPPLKHGGPVRHAALTPDGRRVVTASQDKTARVWDLPMDDRPAEDLVQLAELLAGYRLDEQGGMNPLDGDSWNRSWDILHGRYPAQFVSTPQEVREWHREEAAACAAAGLWSGAILHHDLLLKLDPGNADSRSLRGQALAALGHWPEAAAGFEKAQESQPDLQLAGWHSACLAAAGNWAAHRRACADVLAHFDKDVDGNSANSLAWLCVRFRVGSGDVDRPLNLAEQAVAARPQEPAYLNTLGAALYRAGRFEDAVRKLQEAIGVQNTEGTASHWLFLALAHHRLGHTEEAKKWLAKAQRWLDQAPKDGAGALPWDQRLELKLLRAEAEAVIGK